MRWETQDIGENALKHDSLSLSLSTPSSVHVNTRICACSPSLGANISTHTHKYTHASAHTYLIPFNSFVLTARCGIVHSPVGLKVEVALVMIPICR